MTCESLALVIAMEDAVCHQSQNTRRQYPTTSPVQHTPRAEPTFTYAAFNASSCSP